MSGVLPPTEPDQVGRLDLPGVDITVLRFGRMVFTVANYGTAEQRVLTEDVRSYTQSAEEAYARQLCVQFGVPQSALAPVHP